MNAIAHLISGWGHQRKYLKTRSLGKLSLLLILLASTTIGALPQSSGPNSTAATWDIYPVDAPAFFFMLTDRTLDFRSDGDACMAYGGDALYYSCFDHGTETWTTELVDSDPTVGSYAALAINAQDKPYISYYDAENGDLKLAYVDFLGVWQIMTIEQSFPRVVLTVQPEDESSFELDAFKLPIYPTSLLAPTDVTALDDLGIGMHTSIAIDSVGGIHISYYDTYTTPDSGMLKYAFWDGWSAPMIEIIDNYHDQGDTGLWTSIAIGDRDIPHIAYMSEKYDDLMYANRGGGGGAGGYWVIEQVDSGAVGTYASIAIDSQNRAHISYFDFGSSSLRHAYRKGRDDWFLTVVDSTDTVGFFTSIAISSKDRIYISYYDATHGNLKLAQTSFGDWNSWSKSWIERDGDVGYYTSIALREDSPAIFFFNLTTGYLEYTWWDPDTSNRELSTLTEHYIADVGVATSLVLSSAGAPHISYMDDTRDFLKYAQTISLTWETSFVSDEFHAGSWSSIDLLNDLQPVIAFYDMDERDLILATWTGIEWEFEEIDTDGDVGQYVSMKIDSGGNYHISYYDATVQRLKYAYKESGDDTWDILELDRDWAGLFTSLDLDPFDRPYISYFDAQNEAIMVAFKSATETWLNFTVASVGDPTDDEQVEEAYSSIAAVNYLTDIHVSYYNETLGDLEYVYFDGSWNYEPLDTVGDVGKYNSLAIDPVAPNARHICYYDGINGDLKYAYWDGVSWAYEIVDSDGDVGRFCSLDLNSAGEPAISYYDDSGRDLMYATSFTLPDVQVYEVFVPIVMNDTD